MLKVRKIFGLFFLIFLLGAPWVYADISVVGRLTLEKSGEREELILSGKNAEAYLIKGALIEKLKGLVLNLGKDNLVSVTGTPNGSYTTSCHNSYSFDKRGNKIMDSKCLRYYHLIVTRLDEAKESKELMPPPKRDREAEERAQMSAMPNLTQPDLGQIITREATVASLNLRSPVKTMEIDFLDKDKQPRKEALLLGSDMRVAKRNPANDKEPMFVSINALHAGQKITVVYSKGEFKNQALFITITKE